MARREQRNPQLLLFIISGSDSHHIHWGKDSEGGSDFSNELRASWHTLQCQRGQWSEVIRWKAYEKIVKL